jgi:uncharacterized membrane protein YfcA
MELLPLFGYFAAILIGISLGLIGGGGSILTVPILVYLFHQTPEIATSYSLFIVGITSLIGAFAYYKRGEIDIKTSLLFGAPSILAVYFTRKFLLPSLPPTLWSWGNIEITKDLGLMLLFAILMIAASVSMIRNKKADNTPFRTRAKTSTILLIFLEGTVVGILTGLVGAGGGFLIIPALVLLTGLPMKKAIGSSLLIISFKSLIGFSGDVTRLEIDYFFLLTLSLLAILGIIMGGKLSTKINEKKLKPAFGWFVLIMGIYILWKEITS